MGNVRGRVGTFLTRKMQPQSIRQKHFTGEQGNGRQTFNFPRHWFRMNMRQNAMRASDPRFQRDFPETHFRHLPGDVQLQPTATWAPEERSDKAVCQWAARGRYQLHQVGGCKETFVCQRCGYPVKSRLVAIKDDNWDFRYCYRCYNAVVHASTESY